MVKKTKRRTFAADKHNSKTRVDQTAKVNPFDLHVNRLKHDVLGKRRNYEKGGQPLKARSRGIEKRKRTLLKELNSVFKKNTFIDHRLGENDPTLTAEEKLMQRLIAERSKTRPGKESRYNLNDEEDLTHYGQSLSKSDELNQRPIIDDYDDDDLNKGRINSEHFFGGFQSSIDQQKPQTKKEWIEHMIKTTKLDKYERQRENEKIYDLTENLDEQWKALSTLMGIKEKRPKEKEEIKESTDDYDKLVNALRFEAKTSGLPVKTIEEKERETAERLKNLKVEETQRMEQPKLKSILSKNRPQTHLSVEELDESYYIMDGSKKRVTFDDEDNVQDQALPPIETEESNGNGEEEKEEEEEETTTTDLIAEFDEIPSNLDTLQARLSSDKNALNLIWKRINNSRLPPIPKSVLTNYFDVLLDYYESVDFNELLLNQIAKQLLQLFQLVNNEQIQTNILDRLKQYHENLVEQIEQDKFTEIDQSFILFLKLIAYLYPTSDYRHSITTPALTLLIQSIAHTSLKSLSSCRQSLFLIELAKQWISKSHRYMPEVIVLFRKIFQLACPIEKSKDFISFSSKQISNRELLVITKAVKSKDKIDYSQTEILDQCLRLFNDFLNIYQSLSAIVEILQPFQNLLQTIAETSKCEQISSQCRDLLTRIESILSTSLSSRRHLVQGKEPTKSLRLFEPRFGPVYEGKKNTRLPKEQAEHHRMQKKYKREFKATSRAIRLDNEFIAREELQQQMAKDTQRKRKVKDLQAELSMQEGEFRKLQKLK